VTTRLYPVEFAALKERLAADMQANYDYTIHLGQAPGRASIALETIGLNIALDRDAADEDARPLVDDGPPAYRSALPLANWAIGLREYGVPAHVSFHAGTYLCNAALYLSHYFAESLSLKTRSAFLHVPLDPAQVVAQNQDLPSLSVRTTTAAVRWLLAQLR
jgi:pyroglutamyl-peptidase